MALPMETKFPRTEKSLREYNISFNCCSAKNKKLKYCSAKNKKLKKVKNDNLNKII